MPERNHTFRIAVRKFDPFEQALARHWQSFCAQTGCALKLDAPALDLHPLHDATLKHGGLAAGDFDLALINTDWIAEARETGQLADLTPLIQADPPEGFDDGTGWSDSMLGFQNFGGQIVALPFHDGPECLIVRKDLFESVEEREAFRTRHGRELEVPTTWAAFVEAAEFFHRPEQNLHGTVVAAFPDGHNTVFDFALQTWTHGGEIEDARGRLTLNTPAAAAGMAFYRRLLQNPKAVHPRCADYDSVKTGFAFARGEAAMMVNWFGFATMAEVVDDTKVRGRIDLHPIPHAEGCATAALNCYWMLAVAEGSPHRQIAYDFAKHCVSVENDKQTTLLGVTGCRKSTWHDPDVNAQIPYYHRLDRLHEGARTLPRRADWSRVADIIDALVLRVIQTQDPIAAILTEAQRKVEQL